MNCKTAAGMAMIAHQPRGASSRSGICRSFLIGERPDADALRLMVVSHKRARWPSRPGPWRGALRQAAGLGRIRARI